MNEQNSPILPCKGIHTWGSFRPMPVQKADGTSTTERRCPSCQLTMMEFASRKTPDRQRKTRK